MNIETAYQTRQFDRAVTHATRESGHESGRIGEIEVLRAVAILMVLLAHFPFNLLFWPTWVTHFLFETVGLWTGVDLFFAISGFVIARSLLPLLEDVTDATAFIRLTLQFWLRRAWRLWPSAWFWLAAALPLCLLFNSSQAFGTLPGNWAMFVAGITNLANFHQAYIFYQPHRQPAAFVQWSLSLEEQFYLLLPIAIFLCRRFLALPMLLILGFAFISPDTPIAMMLRGGAVAAGVLLAIWSRHPTYGQCRPEFFRTRRSARIAALTLSIAILCSLGSATLGHVVPFYLGPIALTCGFLVWLASHGNGYLWRPGAPRRVMEHIAARSYSLYLVHIPVYFGMHEIWFRLHGMTNPTRTQAIAYIACTLLPLAAISELNHRLIENPLRRHGRIAAERFAARHREALT
jgi:peptidoglycan/LPS O-acetylase OafA/YrhL